MAKREEILDAALEVMAREGYRGTSVREIASAVELSQAGLMHHFASKDELFTEILRRRDEVDEAIFVTDPGRTMLESLPMVIRHNSEVPGLVHLFVSFLAEATAPGHHARKFFTDRFERFREAIANDIRSGQEAGDFRAGIDPRSAARELLALADGLQAQWLLNPDFDMADIVANVINSWRTEN